MLKFILVFMISIVMTLSIQNCSSENDSGDSVKKTRNVELGCTDKELVQALKHQNMDISKKCKKFFKEVWSKTLALTTSVESKGKTVDEIEAKARSVVQMGLQNDTIIVNNQTCKLAIKAIELDLRLFKDDKAENKKFHDAFLRICEDRPPIPENLKESSSKTNNDESNRPNGISDKEANTEHLEHLKEGAARWNKYKKGFAGKDINLSNIDLPNFDFRGYDLFRVDFSGSNLSGSNFEGVKVWNAKMVEANLENVNFKGAYIKGNDFTKANLSNANLKEAERYSLRNGKFIEANLSGCDLSGTDLWGADFSNANLTNSDFTDARMYKCKLSGAKMKGTKLKGADVSGCDLDGAVIDGASFIGLKYDPSTTIFPKGFDVDAETSENLSAEALQAEAMKELEDETQPDLEEKNRDITTTEDTSNNEEIKNNPSLPDTIEGRVIKIEDVSGSEINLNTPPSVHSVLENDFKKYGPKNLVDGTLEKAWCEGNPDDGVGIEISIRGLGDQPISGLAIYGGYGKSESIFKNNNRVKELELSYLIEGKGVMRTTLQFQDEEGWQKFNFHEPLSIADLKLKILSVHKGSKYQDLCISELKLFGKGF